MEAIGPTAEPEFVATTVKVYKASGNSEDAEYERFCAFCTVSNESAKGVPYLIEEAIDEKVIVYKDIYNLL